MIGTRLGPYEILEQLGAGGMGEVWLAQDTRLGRKVAVKVLPEQFASDPERLARFEQEARAAAALNHPHIATVHDVGLAEGVHYLVQEYLRGQSLRDHLDGRELPLERGLGLASEIASALKTAHRAGIVHRDLKPENVFVSEDGHAKVLDFGLAKLTEAAASPLGSQSMSPTVLGTQAGSVMGTAGYMAPEQVNGDPVDQRADLFAFGCLLYELTLGQRAFSGRNVMQTLDLILAEQPKLLEDWPRQRPYQLQWMLAKCLDKSPDRRYQDAGEIMVDLSRLQDDLAGGAAPYPDREGESASTERSETPTATAPHRALAATLALVAALAGAGATWLLKPIPEMPRVHATVVLPYAVPTGGNRPFAISPDGRRLAFVGGESSLLFLRPVDGYEATPIPGTEGASTPFFSPDGAWLGFFAQRQLKKVLLAGGSPQVVAAEPDRVRGAAWGSDGTILIGTGVVTGGLLSVPAAGAESPRVVRLPDEQEGVVSLERPQFLPGSDWRLAVAESGTQEGAQIVAIAPSGNEMRPILPGWDVRFADGFLYVADRTSGLVAVPFDAATAEMTGTVFSLAERVVFAVGGDAYFDVSASGSLVYVPASETSTSTSLETSGLVWANATAGLTDLDLPEGGIYSSPTLSADGRRALVGHAGESGREIWVVDLEREALARVPAPELNCDNPIWSPDGRSAIFSGRSAGARFDLYRQRIDAEPNEPAELLLADPAADLTPGSLSPDGSVLAYDSCSSGPDSCEIRFLAMGQEVAAIESAEIQGARPAFSPNGTLIAYTSVDGDVPEIFVRPYPGPGGRVRVSPAGGGRAIWSPDGGEIIYSVGDTLVAAAIDADPAIHIGAERAVLESADLRTLSSLGTDLMHFDVMPDGKTFLSVRGSSGPAGLNSSFSLRLLTGWTEAVARLSPDRR